MKLKKLDTGDLHSDNALCLAGMDRLAMADRPLSGRPQPDAEHEAVTRITHLRLSHFRNYQSLNLDTDCKTIVLSGANGAGKTNLLEALSLLAPGRGLRRASREELGYYPEAASTPENWSVFAELIGPAGKAAIGTGISEAGEKTRQIRINQAPSTQNNLLTYLSLSWLTPQMDGLFLAAPSQRRRFLDRLALSFDPAHNGRLLRYEKAWRERNHMLAEQVRDEAWLQAIEQILAETGVALMATRADMLTELCRISRQQASQFPQISGKMTGQVADWLAAELPAVDIEDKILSAARINRQRGDFAMPGAHDADFMLQYKGRSAHLASTGEQKALLISMILAHARLQHSRLARPPILLLDDVVAHLDEGRRAELFLLCQQMAAQTWYSGADFHAFDSLRDDAVKFTIKEGQLA